MPTLSFVLVPKTRVKGLKSSTFKLTVDKAQLDDRRPSHEQWRSWSEQFALALQPQLLKYPQVSHDLGWSFRVRWHPWPTRRRRGREYEVTATAFIQPKLFPIWDLRKSPNYGNAESNGPPIISVWPGMTEHTNAIYQGGSELYPPHRDIEKAGFPEVLVALDYWLETRKALKDRRGNWYD